MEVILPIRDEINPIIAVNMRSLREDEGLVGLNAIANGAYKLSFPNPTKFRDATLEPVPDADGQTAAGFAEAGTFNLKMCTAAEICKQEHPHPTAWFTPLASVRNLEQHGWESGSRSDVAKIRNRFALEFGEGILKNQKNPHSGLRAFSDAFKEAHNHAPYNKAKAIAKAAGRRPTASDVAKVLLDQQSATRFAPLFTDMGSMTVRLPSVSCIYTMDGTSLPVELLEELVARNICVAGIMVSDARPFVVQTASVKNAGIGHRIRGNLSKIMLFHTVAELQDACVNAASGNIGGGMMLPSTHPEQFEAYRTRPAKQLRLCAPPLAPVAELTDAELAAEMDRMDETPPGPGCDGAKRKQFVAEEARKRSKTVRPVEEIDEDIPNENGSIVEEAIADHVGRSKRLADEEVAASGEKKKKQKAEEIAEDQPKPRRTKQALKIVQRPRSVSPEPMESGKPCNDAGVPWQPCAHQLL